MPEQCCGKERTTAFCPDCGKKMQQGSPLHEMRRHFATRRKIITTGVDKNKLEIADIRGLKNGFSVGDGRDIRALERDIRNGEKQILKWSRWIDALDAILSPQEEKTDE